MPELIEVELYRQRAEALIGRTIRRIEMSDLDYIRGESHVVMNRSLPGQKIESASRHGKVLILETDGSRLGLRFGMTGKLLVDGQGPIGRLQYTSARDDPAWVRFRIRFDVGELTISDPRRLGSVELEPDLSKLGPDAVGLSVTEFRRVLEGSNAPLKSRLLDQAKLAGVGNLICDETLYRAGIAPGRPAGSLDQVELKRLSMFLRTTIASLTKRGGSHMGELQAERHRHGRCPRCGSEISLDTIGGRSTYWCRTHQS